MKPVSVALLWHMHQPSYRDPVSGRYEMPWVFLHAIKDYYDMLHLATRNGCRCTFNLVPSLLRQLEEYASGEANDKILSLIATDPGRLNEEERPLLLRYLFYANEQHMIGPLPRYREMLERKKAGRDDFSADEIQDLQVLFLLAWCGNELKKEELVQQLRRKGRHFSAAEKRQLIDLLMDFVGKIIPAYREAARQGLVEISATPYYHPILPLLINMDRAREAMPTVSLPDVDNELFAPDAARQVRMAQDYMRQIDLPVQGFWPSEGSVSPEAAQLFAQEGVKWIATDEEVLARSLDSFDRDAIYQVYEHEGVPVLFRDRELSDLVGFVYSTWDQERGAQDLVVRLEKIAQRLPQGGVIPVFLDGENAWEHYAEDGKTFLTKFYQAVKDHADLQFVTVSEAVGNHKPRQLTRLHSGSWIYASFSTWVGHREKNRAWELLNITRRFLQNNDPQQQNPQAWEAMMAAEGSDWFWWLGDDQHSELKDLFDLLFREHLLTVYRSLGHTPPSGLFTPIRKQKLKVRQTAPTGHIKPRIDGRQDSFFSWLHAGYIDLRDGASMHRDQNLLDVHYGYSPDGQHLFLKVRCRQIPADNSNRLDIVLNDQLSVRAPFYRGATAEQEHWLVAVDDEVEARISLERIAQLRQGEDDRHYRLTLVHIRDEEEQERTPLHWPAMLESSDDMLLKNWVV
ncbi:glycoside hydrolase family 57 protein [Desulfurispira natronophila]|uniref:Alpha-amylase/alpha-mannosidase (GH57 family) n=1 Tax=Desulfurispira natronophila TaxID=682562 RepID=A0A7W7Y378_9BACT|nr:glycoside hydrolase family 57 protein [Desulfurispira natronophila]MBB5021261.1 alpha-amylase/alpha-mannosidase (GH57 family) [Desulfurispira natronophila]